MKSVFPGSTSPADHEPALAFRLLCEAFKLKEAEDAGACSGIEIHAPKGAAQWFAAFREEGRCESGVTNDAIDEIAGMIGSGAIKDLAITVLVNAFDHNSTALVAAINAFLNEAAKPNG